MNLYLVEIRTKKLRSIMLGRSIILQRSIIQQCNIKPCQLHKRLLSTTSTFSRIFPFFSSSKKTEEDEDPDMLVKMSVVNPDHRVYKDSKTKVILYSHKRKHGEPTWVPPSGIPKPLWYKRIGATLIDAGFSFAFGTSCMLIILLELDNMVLATSTSVAGFSVAFVFR